MSRKSAAAGAVEVKQWVAIDLHRRRSQVARLDDAGELVSNVRIDNSVERLVAEVLEAGVAPEVVIEATFGWYWAVDALQAAGAHVHLAHPRGLKGLEGRRVKTDRVDAEKLARLLRLGEIPEAWIAPPEIRALRELVRHRWRLVRLRSGTKASLHAVLGKCGVLLPIGDIFGPVGAAMLDGLELPEPYASHVASQRRLIAAFDAEVVRVDRLLAKQLKGNPHYKALQTIKGIGPTFAATFLAEIGDIDRFPNPAALASWAGLTPTHYESDGKARRGHITKQGSRLLRWAAIEACQTIREPWLAEHRRRIVARRGRKAKHIATVAAARRLLHVVFWTWREGHARCLDTPVAAAG